MTELPAVTELPGGLGEPLHLLEPGGDWLTWIWLGLSALATVLLWLWRRRRRPKPAPAVAASPRPAPAPRRGPSLLDELLQLRQDRQEDERYREGSHQMNDLVRRYWARSDPRFERQTARELRRALGRRREGELLALLERQRFSRREPELADWQLACSLAAEVASEVGSRRPKAEAGE